MLSFNTQSPLKRQQYPIYPTQDFDDQVICTVCKTQVHLKSEKQNSPQCPNHLRFAIRVLSFPHTFHIGKANKTTTYKSFSKYCKHVKQTPMLGTARMLPTDEKHDGLLHRLTKNKHIEVNRCRWFKKEHLKGFR